MKNSLPLLSILVAALFGMGAHAGEFTLGSAQLLAQSSAQAGVDVSVNFTDRGRTTVEPAEGGDAAATHDAHSSRGADAAAAETSQPRVHAQSPAAKSVEPAIATTDSPHGVSISPTEAIRRPSYRWQSLVPGTIK